VKSEDERLAHLARVLRQTAGLRQRDLSTSRYVAQEVEAGRAGQLRLDLVRSHFCGLGAKPQLNIWWNGAALDRLLDEAHAGVVETTAGVLAGYRFRVKTEYSFSDYGERGSIDIFGGRDDVQALFVGEAKSEWGSLEETLRRQDVKVRLAPKLAKAAFGWSPRFVASVLIFPDDRSSRRVTRRYEATLSAYPARAREIRAWLRQPTGKIGGIWFLTNARQGGHGSEEGP
jgi:hypothetical protein